MIDASLLPTVLVRFAYPITFEMGFAAAALVRGILDTERSAHPDRLEANAEELVVATGLPIEALLELDPVDWDALNAAHLNALHLAKRMGASVSFDGTPYVH